MSILSVYFTCPIFCIITLLLVRFELNFVEHFPYFRFRYIPKNCIHTATQLQNFATLQVLKSIEFFYSNPFKVTWFRIDLLPSFCDLS